jgi:DNA-directed RNA polymerase specialized sigma24 family protein
MPDFRRIADWIRAAQAGSPFAFGEIVRSYQDDAAAYAASIPGDYRLAEDAAQEAFIEAYRRRSSRRTAPFRRFGIRRRFRDGFTPRSSSIATA